MSRVWLGHHTWTQVTAGACYGVTLASVWFGMWTGGLNHNAVVRGLEKDVNQLVDLYLRK